MGESATPQEVVVAARRGNCRSLAYTYTEPTVFFEFAYETARLGHSVRKTLENTHRSIKFGRTVSQLEVRDTTRAMR